MIYAKDMNIHDNFTDNFNRKWNLEQDPKYKLPYLESHGFRRGNFLIDGKVEDVYLSVWKFKIRNIDFKRISVLIEEYPGESYVMMITHWHGGQNTCKFYEGLEHIPNWEEIEGIVRSDF